MIKQETIDSIKRYVEFGIPTGDFLYAVLTNNLAGAVGRADRENLSALAEIVQYVYNNIPSACWGSPDKVELWLESKREKYLTKSEEVLK